MRHSRARHQDWDPIPDVASGAVQTHKLRTADGCGLTAVSATPVSPPGRSETLKMKKPYTGSTRLRGRGGLSLLMPVLVRPP